MYIEDLKKIILHFIFHFQTLSLFLKYISLVNASLYLIKVISLHHSFYF